MEKNNPEWDGDWESYALVLKARIDEQKAESEKKGAATDYELQLHSRIAELEAENEQLKLTLGLVAIDAWGKSRIATLNEVEALRKEAATDG